MRPFAALFILILPLSLLAVSDDPDYPMKQTKLGYEFDQKNDPHQVIQTIEPILTQRVFKVSNIKRTANGDQVDVHSFGYWRDFAYTLLARAYYEINDLKKAKAYLNSFPKDSPFYAIATIQNIWTLLRQGDYEGAERVMNSTEIESTELKLQKAFLLLKQNQLNDVLKVAQKISFPSGHYLENLRLKIMSQALFSQYQVSIQTSFVEKEKLINEVIVHSQKVSENARDHEFAYFLGEVYWHKASLLRVTDPVKYQLQINEMLDLADRSLRPWVSKSISENKPYLTEEAFFLESVVLWEQKKFKEALPYLLATTKLFPQTIYREDIYQLVADYYYDSGQFTESLEFYRKLTASGREDKSIYGIYKAAWVFYNLNQKFKALRHLERLVQFHQKHKESEAPLKNESEKDMLLLLGELLPYSDSLQELSIYNYAGEDWYQIREDLAKTYNKLGKFDDAVSIYKFLLDKSPRHARSDGWLEDLLHNHLSAGQRREIARSLAKYGNKDRPPAPGSGLEKKIVWLQLTLHKEATKTEDPNIWLATDELYEVVSKNLPNLKVGDFWYFGAQRLEKRGKKWEAIAWYKKSSQVSDYENGADAALSAMRIAQNLIEEESLKKEVHLQTHQKLAVEAKWFLASYPKLEQYSAVEKLYLEALFKSRNFAEAKEYLIHQKQMTPSIWANYSLYNRYLYDSKEWSVAYDLSNELLQSNHLTGDMQKSLAGIRQETAFQAAFALEEKDKPASREWYSKVVKYGVDPSTQLKSWHNILLSFKNTETEKILRSFSDFEQWISTAHLQTFTYDDHQMLRHIYRQGATAHLTLGHLNEYWDSLLRIIPHEEDENLKLQLQWEVVVGAGSWYEKERFLSEWEKVKNTKFAKEDKNLLTIVRIFDLLGMTDQAWELLEPKLNANSTTGPTVGHWLRLRDLVYHSESHKELHEKIMAWLAEHKKQALAAEPLQAFWARETLAQLKGTMFREPSSEKTEKFHTPEDALKFRLESVTRILQNLATSKDELKKYFDTKIPQVVVYGLCERRGITEGASRSLASLGEPVIAAKQWPQFINKLNSKVSELKSVAVSEQKDCEAKKAEIAFYDSVIEHKGPLCLDGSCVKPRLLSMSSLASWLRRTQATGVERVWELIEMGAWATAEFEAAAITHDEERSVAQALIRMAEDDRWSAVLLLREIKDKDLKVFADLLLARIKASNGQPYAPPDEAKTGLKLWQREFL